MKYASVCSGVEAASLAWMPLGWEAAWFSEIEPFPCAVLKERFPSVPNLGDMTKIKVENLSNGDQKFTGGDGTTCTVRGGVDLLVGGTPCQGFSVAGKQGGLRDDRSVLCLTFVRLLETMRPRWFVWENVPGVFSTGGGGRISEHSCARLMKSGLVAHGVCWTLNLPEFSATLAPFLKEDGVCSLSDTLLPTGAIPQRYFLSRTACFGILRRAASRVE